MLVLLLLIPDSSGPKQRQHTHHPVHSRTIPSHFIPQLDLPLIHLDPRPVFLLYEIDQVFRRVNLVPVVGIDGVFVQMYGFDAV